jgi:C-terminal domain 7 of the ABC-three component (ABC-3C) systems
MVATGGEGQAAGTLEASNPFDASASAAGYAMQFRYALFCAIQRLQSGDLNWQISIEAGDDVEVISRPGYTSLYQLKLRAENTTLSDSARDLWKTLRIWVELYASDAIDFQSTQFFLVSTSAAATGGVAQRLGQSPGRDVEAACNLLDAVATSSVSRENLKAYAAWKALSKESKIALLEHVQVIVESPGIQETKQLLENSCHLSVRRPHVTAFVSRLEGWWFQRCIDILRTPGVQYIAGEEFDAAYSDLRDSFLPENLPIDSDVPLLAASLQFFSDYLFMKQTELVGVGESRIASAVRDYLRAYTQRSRWVRESLVGAAEMQGYERRLVEEWRYVFDRLKDDLPAAATEQTMSEMAKKVYQWVEEASAPPIRSQCTERFLVRGSLHMLADRIDSGVGWHPEFVARLIEILEPVSR